MNNRKFWTENEITYLFDNFSNKSNKELSVVLNRTVSAISKKAKKFNIEKNNDYLTKMRDERNKKINLTRKKLPNRNLTPENLKKIALKYKTRYEFQKYDSRAYQLSLQLKILNNVCSHMLYRNNSIPQLTLFEILKTIFSGASFLYNNRKIIKPYELDIYINDYNLGFEYNGKYWHTNNERDLNKKELCDKKNINLIVINEKTKNYYDDIITQLISNLDFINKICNSSLTEIDLLNINENNIHQLVNKNILDFNDIKNIISKYAYLSDFRKNDRQLYNILILHKVLNKYTSQLIRRKILTINDIILLINKYVYHSDFVRENIRCYNTIKRRKLDYLLDNLIKTKTRWNFDLIKKEIQENKFNNIKQINEYKRGMYKYIIKNNLLNKCENLFNEIKNKNNEEK